MRPGAFVIAAAVSVAACATVPARGSGAALAACLHGDGETAAEAARRTAALGWVRAANTAQARAAAAAGGVYQPLDALGNLPGVPDGFAVRMTTDGASYALAAIDVSDPCRFGYFSDQAGVIYTGAALQ